MIIDEPMLRAYVDGELDPVTREQVEAVLANSVELQAQVQSLHASCLPYRTAFEAQAWPEPPAGLLRQVAALGAVAAAPQALLTGGPPDRRRALGVGLAMAASFVAGLALPWRQAMPPAHGADDAPWVRPIAGYHALYVRETVDLPPDAPARIRALLTGFGEPQKPLVFVRNLESAGLVFKRVQRLGFGDVPLIQMVYLAARGRPAALCVLPAQVPNALPRGQRLEGLGVATWVQGGLAHVLLADLPADDTLVLARRLAAGEFPRA